MFGTKKVSNPPKQIPGSGFEIAMFGTDRLQNPTTKEITTVSNTTIIWCLLFFPWYFLYRGTYRHFLLSLSILLVLGVIAWNILSTFAALDMYAALNVDDTGLPSYDGLVVMLRIILLFVCLTSIIYSLLARKIVVRHLLNSGWKKLS